MDELFKTYRKKPVEVQAAEWQPGTRFENMLLPEDDAWPGSYIDKEGNRAALRDDQALINTWEGQHVVNPGNFVIIGVKGEMYPCDAEVFALTYTAVND